MQTPLSGSESKRKEALRSYMMTGADGGPIFSFSRASMRLLLEDFTSYSLLGLQAVSQTHLTLEPLCECRQCERAPRLRKEKFDRFLLHR